MPIRMLADTEKPARKKGKLYNPKEGEGWPLVRDGYAEWEYVPETKIPALPHAEKKAGK